MQQKYLLEAYDLYGADFHIVKLPLKTEEVRGADKIKEFSKVRPRAPPSQLAGWPASLPVLVHPPR